MNEQNGIRIKEAFDYLHIHRRDMTGAQMQLIDSMKRQFRRNKTLSEKQIKVLTDIKKYLYE